ncbi:MAG: chromosome segregation protein SMC [Candidatus Eisenbacteria bacterium]
MIVSRIEMVGFKSFVDKTVVDLESGITAVVGPNGCGKTNICDAIRWVLGEENVRLLRGTRVEDVIFAGTALRKPVGFAEVSLTLSDVRDCLPVEYNDVTITRRFYRSGDSDFLINNVPSRLKDIVDLFLGTGLGRRAYSVMEREMIEWILDDTSGQRRKIIEEAAGISKYKSRRRETQSKLELTQRDLERVHDLISEVERRVGQLARQAAKARRYERLTDRIKQVATYASAQEYDSMKKRQGEVAKDQETIDTSMAEQAGRISTLEAEIENSRLAIVGLDEEINQQGRRIARTTQETQKLESDKGVLAERARSIDERLAELARDRSEKQGLVKAKSDLAAAKTGEAGETARRIEGLSKTYRELQDEYRRLDAELRSRREESVASARKRLEDMKRTIDAASSLTEMRARKGHLEETLEKSLAKRGAVVGRLKDLDEEIEWAGGDLKNLSAAFAAEGIAIDDLARVIDEVTHKVDLIRDELQKLAEEGARASSRHDLFKEFMERYEGYENGVRALMQGETERRGVHGVVGDIVRCTEPRFEPALAAALHNALQYVIVDGKEHAIDSVRMLKAEKKGPATLLLLDRIPEGRGGSADPGGEGIMGRVTDFVDCEPRYRGAIEYLLRDFVIVEDLDRAFTLSRQEGNGDHDYVTPDGDAVLRGNIVRAGSNGDSSGVFIGRKQKLCELADRVEALRKLSEEQERGFEELRASRAALQAEREAKQKSHEDGRRSLTDLEKLLESRIAERDLLERSRQELDGEIERLRNLIGAADQEIANLARDPGLPSTDQADLFSRVESHDDLEQQVDALGRRLEETNVEMLRLEAAGSFINDTIARVKGEIEAVDRELADLDQIEREMVEKKRQLAEGHQKLVAEIHRLLGALSDLERQRNDVVAKKRDLEVAVEGARGRIRTAHAEREQFLSARQSLQSELNLLGVKCDTLKQRMLEEYEIDIDSIDFEGLEAIDNCEDELRKLRDHLRNLGPVNLVALEEYDVEKQRYDFLKAQRDDLVKARESLDEAILQINKRARAEFTDTFAKVRQDFRKNFQTLFAGGDADLRLQDENDPLESPVEVLAQPSGKKLDHISLLSGGERALTAIAFIFAVYYTKPSPFCLLDEVDAPLDDANVVRFINLLKNFSGRTQFLMVTHNKRTMESASSLYGVTMQEPGISRIVSVKLERAKEAVAGTPGA